MVGYSIAHIINQSRYIGRIGISYQNAVKVLQERGGKSKHKNDDNWFVGDDGEIVYMDDE